MNNLSLFLYFADVVTSVAGVITGLTVLSAAILTFMSISYAVEEGKFYQHFGKHLAITIICALLAALIPSKNTLYAIAASELGESALKSRIGEKSMKALESWLDQQINKMEKSK